MKKFNEQICLELQETVTFFAESKGTSDSQAKDAVLAVLNEEADVKQLSMVIKALNNDTLGLVKQNPVLQTLKESLLQEYRKRTNQDLLH